MKKEEIRTPEDLLDYIMSKYEEVDYFSTHEMECIRDGFEEWVEQNFDGFKEDGFEDIDIIAETFLREDYKDYSSNREF